jgi:murein endopeptidase
VVPPFYRDLMAEMDSNRDGKVTAEEIRQALAVRDPLVKNVVNRLVVKHHSEWCGAFDRALGRAFIRIWTTLEVEYCEKWQADLEWMSKVPPFDRMRRCGIFIRCSFLCKNGRGLCKINLG